MDILCNSEITFGSAFHLLATLSNGQFGSRDALFETVFNSYHTWRSAELDDCNFRTSPSLISSITKNNKPVPRKFIFYYMQDEGAALRNDLNAFFIQALRTQRLEEIYFESILTFVNNSTNLAPRDKEYILQAVNTTVSELWFRTFFVLMLEPIDFAKVS